MSVRELEEERLQDVARQVRAFALDRRDFLKLCGGGLLVCMAGESALAQESGGRWGNHRLPEQISAWLYIDAHGRVTVYTGKVEVGQNIRTSLAQSVAEELRTDFDTITMVMGDTDLVPWDAGTFGSRTTPTMGPQLRKMAAAARNVLAQKAAQQWKADASTLVAARGTITNPATKQAVSYGALTRGEKLTETVTAEVPLTPATEWKIAGTAVSKVDGRDFVTGRHRYPSDILRPGMMYGKVVRPSGFRATLVSVDTSTAEKMPGVQIVRDGDFIGVVAADAWTAEKAAAAVEAKWAVPPQIDNAELFEYLKKHAESGDSAASSGVEQALANAEVKLDAEYRVQYIQHAPLEPRAAVAEWNGNHLTVWTGTQRPFGVRDELAQAFRLAANQVRVLMPDMGSGYGGKHTGECAVECARLAKAAGKPVKLVWTREEEFTWAYFRPAGVISIRSGAKRDGTLTAWEQTNINSGPSGVETPYNVAAKAGDYREVADPPLRQGSYRALAATANHFARESHMDELAHALKMDPLDFRLKNLTDARLRAVLRAAAERFGWGRESSSSARGFGIACGTDKGGYVAACAEVEIDAAKKMRIRRVVQAWESGAIVNPDGLRNQTMGAIVQAIGGALFEQIRFANGKILNPLFSDYRVPRFRDTPQIDVVLLDRKDLPSAGAGEIGIVALAPAVGNAIFAATGERLRSMPMAAGTFTA
ncbi:MAG TPA: molybdopterin cofactor-binding domain-containing protein [Acidobacteriaceae bacterium]|jgi:isoquinoline 1-oxidoreductase|nr:molybdopterin cofactor-binding domain-containing protein [Acidobacteriaceae bacterium]